MISESEERASDGIGWPAAALILGALALAFQGSRGIWEPDEGFYVNIAMGMLRSGDWLVPRLTGIPFIEKPPLANWGMAAGMAVLGVNEWGARLAHAVWFAATALLVGALGESMWNRRTGIAAALAYGTSLLPFMAANIATTDTPLAFCAAAALFCYWKASEGELPRARALWWAGAGLATGLGILAKGPAMLILAFPIFVIHLVRRGWRGVFLSPWPYTAGAIALLVGLPWYALIVLKVPGAGAFMLDNQVVGRLVTSSYRRNSGPLGGVAVYLPMLAIGSLPWSLFWPKLLWPSLRTARVPGVWGWMKALPGRPRLLFIAAWIALPTAVLMIARSRLPLYVLPVFAPLALATVRGLEVAASAERFRRTVRAALIAGALFVVLKGAAAFVHVQRDARALAAGIREAAGPAPTAVFAVDAKCNGLPFYGITDFHWITEEGGDYPYFVPLPALDEALDGLKSRPRRSLFLISESKTGKFGALLRRARLECAPREGASGYGFLVCEPFTPAP